MPKISRKDLCPCGSGRNFTECCQKQQTNTQGPFRIREVLYNGSTAVVQGFIIFKNHLKNFRCSLQRETGYPVWMSALKDLVWLKEESPELNLADLLINILKLWDVRWMRGIPVEEGGVKLELGQIECSDAVVNEAFIIHRINMQFASRPRWDGLWRTIENRAQHDPDVLVQGFSREEFGTAICRLSPYYTGGWLESTFRRCHPQEAPGSEAFVWANIPHDSQEWFPLHHLLGFANGLLLKNPGFNALVTLGTAVPILMKLRGGERILHNLIQPGGIHAANLIYHLHETGRLVSIEDPTGGRGENDVRVSLAETMFDIEVKALTSARPRRAILSELREKNQKLPADLERPVLFLVIPVEKGKSDEDYARLPGTTDSVSSDDLGNLQNSDLESFPKISGVIITAPYIDQKGGHVRWELTRYVPNPAATLATTLEVVTMLLAPDGPPRAIPIFYLNTLIQTVV